MASRPAYGMIAPNFFSHVGKSAPRILRFTSVISAQPSSAENGYPPYIFEGVHNLSIYPYVVKYYNSSTAQQYWGLAGISSNVPVLQLNSAQEWTQGLVFWNKSYTYGENVNITLIGVYTSGVRPVADGFEVYLFLKPTMWNVSPYWNESSTFPALISNYKTVYPSAQGEVALPQSSTQYIIVQWDPWLQIGTGEAGTGGQWNIRIVSNHNNNYGSLVYIPYIAVGEGSFTPNPGDYILFSVTYIPNNDTIIGIAKDLNTGQESTLTFRIPNFSPPSSGYYVFGIGASTGGAKVANWGIIYTNVPALKPLFLNSLIYDSAFTQKALSSTSLIKTSIKTSSPNYIYHMLVTIIILIIAIIVVYLGTRK